MKKILAIALCAALSLSFAACGGETEETDALDTTVAETAAAPKATEAENVVESVVESAAETVAETDAKEVEILTGSEAATVEDAVKELESLLDLLKSGDKDAIVALSGSDAPLSDELLMEMLVAMFAKLDYSFGTPVVTDNTAVVPAEITAVNITTIFTEYMIEAAKHTDDETWDSDGSYFIELCKSDKVAPTATQVDVSFELADGIWTTSADNAAFVSALFGGLL